MQTDDDVAVAGPILFLIAVIFGIGLYNEISKALDSSEKTNVEQAEIYTERAEKDLRTAQRDSRSGAVERSQE